MSTHPNTILLLTIIPQDLSRKTMAAILAEFCSHDEDDISIAGQNYHHKIMEEEWDEGYQISSREGDLLFFNFVTYGYGEQIEWSELERRKRDLDNWAKEICEKHHCEYRISLTANYW